MEMYRFLLSSDTTRGAIFVLFAVIAGLLQSLSAYLIGLAAERLRFGYGSNIYHLALFVAVLGLLGVTLQRATTLGLLVAERSTGRMAIRLAGRVRDVSLVRLEQIGAERILAAIALDMTTVASAAVTAVNAVISATALASAAVVILLVTPGIVIAWLPFVLLVLAILRAAEPAIRAAAARADVAEKAFCALATHALEGFKELRLDTGKMRDLVGRFALDAALGVLHEGVRAGTQYAARLVSIHVLRFITIGAIVYVLPQFGVVVGGTVALVVVAFSFQSLLEIIAYQPILSNCAVSLQRLSSLEQDLRKFHEPAPAQFQAPRPCISSVRLNNVSFTYTDRSGAAVFAVGPIALTLEAGQILFVAGRNGSGKSTFLKLLTGLYPPTAGSIEVDGEPIGLFDHRGLFSTVFTDFHLFDQLYGLRSPDLGRVQELLGQLRLSQKVAVANNAFSTTRLSTGQRKRLALVAAVLEDRPIIIFDEWTADQDPEFRETFYKDLLPQLRREGKTVIAVSHDDRYFAYCDRLITMQDGRVTGDKNYGAIHSSTS